MRYLRSTDIDGLVGRGAAEAAIRDAFEAVAAGSASMQPRLRTVAGAGKLSTMGAVIDDLDVLGAKVYSTTPAGQFRFLILLFGSGDGRPRAIIEAAGLTALRTAATSVVAARLLARPDSRILTVFGAGTQARAHLRAFGDAFPLEEIRVVHRRPVPGFVAAVESETGVTTRQVEGTQEALDAAALVVTTTRARAPLFAGDLVAGGAHVTAVGATRPDVRELDDRLIQRADVIAVEWVEQARHEAGDLIGAARAGLFRWEHAVELAELVSASVPARRHPDDVTVFESVGIGLEDVAVATLALHAAEERGLGVELP